MICGEVGRWLHCRGMIVQVNISLVVDREVEGERGECEMSGPVRFDLWEYSRFADRHFYLAAQC
jgi:hypothetical protein